MSETAELQMPVPRENKLMMRAAVLAGPRQICIEEVPAPEPKESCVRVRLEGCGLCGSNLAPWEGRPWMKYPFMPGAPGHEGWGVVDSVGTKVTRWKPGDRVTLLSYNAFAEYDTAGENMLVRVPKSLGDQPLPGEPLGCAVNVFKRSGIYTGQIVAIVGIGFLGALLTSMAAKAGAFVIAISRRSFALDMARQLGARKTICLGERNRVVEEVRQITNGHDCDCVIESTGQASPLDLAAELTRTRGRLVIAGYHQDPRQINMQLWNWRGLDVINAHERDANIYLEGMQSAVKALETGALDPRPLYTHSFPLNEIGTAFQVMKDRPDKFLKAVITL